MAGGELEQIQFLLGHVSVQNNEDHLADSLDGSTPVVRAEFGDFNSAWKQTARSGVDSETGCGSGN